MPMGSPPKERANIALSVPLSATAMHPSLVLTVLSPGNIIFSAPPTHLLVPRPIGYIRRNALFAFALLQNHTSHTTLSHNHNAPLTIHAQCLSRKAPQLFILFDSRPHSWYSYDKQIRKIRVNLPTRGHERLVFSSFRVLHQCS